MVSKGKGRQKIEMKRMTNDSNRMVTFSKRRAGVFKKASELCTLTGAEIGIIGFSPRVKKAFSYGHPSVEAITERFLNETSVYGSTSSALSQWVDAHQSERVHELNMELTQVMNQLEAEKKLSQEISKINKPNQEKNWWESPVEELTLDQLQQLKAGMEELKNNITVQAEKLHKLESLNHHTADTSAAPSYGAAPDTLGIGPVGPMPPDVGQSMTPWCYDTNYGSSGSTFAAPYYGAGPSTLGIVFVAPYYEVGSSTQSIGHAAPYYGVGSSTQSIGHAAPYYEGPITLGMGSAAPYNGAGPSTLNTGSVAPYYGAGPSTLGTGSAAPYYGADPSTLGIGSVGSMPTVSGLSMDPKCYGTNYGYPDKHTHGRGFF